MNENSVIATVAPVIAERRLRNVVASQDLEGLATPPEEETMLRRLSRGEISLSEYQEWAKTAYLR